MFTNIPLNETIDLEVKSIFDSTNIKITTKDLKKFSEFATSETHILFDGNYCDHIDAVAMSSTLRSVLANLLMGFYEKQWLKEFNFCKFLLYRNVLIT